jgi:dTMP kinase
MFITFEGLDQSGKTTQAHLLVDRLKKSGKEVLFFREPGGTELSERIRDILLDHKHTSMTLKAEMFLFSAARAQLVSEVIRPALQKGIIVICDRFHDSTTAYQGYGRGIDLEEVRHVNASAIGGTIPDLTLFLDIEVDEVLRRRNAAGFSADRMESSGIQFYERVRKGYHSIAAEEKGRLIVLDGTESAEEIHQHIWNIIQSRLK